MMEMYEKMGLPPAQLEMMRKTGVVEGMSSWWVWVAPLILVVMAIRLRMRSDEKEFSINYRA
jgi:hypothetical protein